MGLPQVGVALTAGALTRRKPRSATIPPPPEPPGAERSARLGENREQRALSRRRRRQGAGRASVILAGDLGQAQIGQKTLTGQ